MLTRTTFALLIVAMVLAAGFTLWFDAQRGVAILVAMIFAALGWLFVSAYQPGAR